MCESEPIFKDHELAIFKQYMKIRGDLFDAMGMTRNIVLLKKLQKALIALECSKNCYIDAITE